MAKRAYDKDMGLMRIADDGAIMTWLSETPITWYVTTKETIELKMTDGLIATAAQAADALGARYYIRNPRQTQWDIYDTHAEGFGRKIAPLKTIESESIDPAVMWCLAKIGGA